MTFSEEDKMKLETEMDAHIKKLNEAGLKTVFSYMWKDRVLLGATSTTEMTIEQVLEKYGDALSPAAIINLKKLIK